jgi:two-component system, chemotaxis family, CheB/CheR fusion protein
MPRKLKAKAEQDLQSVALPEETTGANQAQNFPIVGIGASAGGLAAFESFFSGMPGGAEIGMAFVLVQHLAPDHKSILTELVKRYTRMLVYEVEDGMEVQPNCAYIIPPNCDMALLAGRLHLLEQTTRHGLRLPIDYFFRSLAQDQHERAICIVLSGTGSDGTLGAREVKGEGGLVMAQSPDSTEFDGMPRSVIATGLVDHILPPAAMPTQLATYVQHAFHRQPATAATLDGITQETLKKIFVVLRAQTSHDFSQYKQNTLIRRIERRMALHRIDRIDDYLRFMQKTPVEVEALFRDLLIGVTSFFRDAEAFESLQTQIIPRIFADKPAGATVRIWVCGCSTGEEAYSIAILIHEYLQTLDHGHKVQIFASDVDRHAIEQARTGAYPASIASDVSANRLARYFILDADNELYRIQKVIRDLLVFSEQDVIKDPPFSKLDLISCRNVLIYMNKDLQRKLMALFHFALTPRGVLFLGASESVGDLLTLFTPIEQKWKIYERQESLLPQLRPAFNEITTPVTERIIRPTTLRQEGLGEAKVDLRMITERALAAHYAQAAVLITNRGEILHVYGRTGKYLEPAPGDATLNILTMAREGLQRELTTALYRAVALREPVYRENLRVRTNGDFSTVNLTVRPVAVNLIATPPNLFLVILDELPLAPVDRDVLPDAETTLLGAPGPNRIAALEQELRAKEEYLQTTVEEMETANEELNSANEEMQSVNEELHSTNEELETSKEELQSLNEELATVNAELQNKIVDLMRVNNDMNNLVAGTGVATLFVDLQLRIARFTPTAVQVINVIQSDVGRPVSHIVSNLIGYNSLVEDVRAVLDTLEPRDAEVRTRAGIWYLMRIRPYRTIENVIEGAVIIFVDITERKRLEGLARLAVVVRDSSDAITVQDLDGRILAWNRSAERLYGWRESEALQMNVSATVPDDKRSEFEAYMRQLHTGEAVEPFSTQRMTKDGRIVDVWLTATRLINEAGEMTSIALTERAITRRPHATPQTK